MTKHTYETGYSIQLTKGLDYDSVQSLQDALDKLDILYSATGVDLDFDGISLGFVYE